MRRSGAGEATAPQPRSTVSPGDPGAEGGGLGTLNQKKTQTT